MRAATLKAAPTRPETAPPLDAGVVLNGCRAPDPMSAAASHPGTQRPDAQHYQQNNGRQLVSQETNVLLAQRELSNGDAVRVGDYSLQPRLKTLPPDAEVAGPPTWPRRVEGRPRSLCPRC
jgi:hypothetical protein